MYPDPTDPSEFSLVPAVPVLDEHEMVDEKRGIRVAVDAAALAEIAVNTNRRASEKRNPCPLIVGHTSDDPQAPERPVVGYAVNFRVLPFAADPTRMCLYADFRVRRDRPTVIRDFPRRSVELWWERKEIDPIALLGGTTPERDLGDLAAGVLKYRRAARSGETLLRCSLATDAEEPTQMARDCDDTPGKGKPDEPAAKKPKKMGGPDAPDTTDPGKPPAAAPDASGDPAVEKVFQDARMVDLQQQVSEIHGAIQEVLDALKGGGGMPGEPGAEPAPGAGGEGDDRLEPDGDEGDEPEPAAKPGLPPAKGKGPPDAEDRKSHEPAPVRFGAAGYPGATGGYVPADKPKEPTKMSRDTDTSPEVIRLQREVRELREARDRDGRLKAAGDIVAGLADGSALKDGTRIKFARKDHDVQVLAELLGGGKDLADDWVEGVKVNYQREPLAPADAPAPDLVRYQRGDAGPGSDDPADPIEAQAAATIVIQARQKGETLTIQEATKKFRLSRRAAAGTV